MKPANSEVSTNAAGAGAVASPWPSWLSREWFFGLILVLAVFLTYQPVWYAGYIWDDDGRLTANPCIIGPFGLKEIWTTRAADLCPLVYTTFWVEHALWGLAPLPYHLVNVLLHAVCAVLLWQVLRSLQVPGAWFGAALWALHPVQVETAAWITEMKNTQSGVFYLLTLLFFVKGLRARATDDRSGDVWNYGLTLLFAALALASKSSTVMLPVVLGLCAWWVEGRWRWRNLARLWPVALMAVFPSALTFWTQRLLEQGPGDEQYARSLPERLVTAGDAVWFYLGKLLWPHPLIFIYPRWEVDAGSWFSWLPLLAVILALFFLWWKRETWSRPYFFAFAYFLGALLPVLGLIDGYFWRYSLVGDHFQYLASMGPLALAGAGLAKLVDVVMAERVGLRGALCAGVLLVLGMLSWHRTWVYQSLDTLWNDTLAQNPNCWLAHNNLGVLFLQRGQVDKAMAQFQKTLEISPTYAYAHVNIGDVLLNKGQVDEAMAQYRKALEIEPKNAKAYYDLGGALFQKGQVDEAIAQYQKALVIDPTYVDAHNNLGIVLAQKGHLDEAIAQYQMVLEIDPNNAKAHFNLGDALFQKGQVDEAIAQDQKALEIEPNNANTHDNLGDAFFQKGQVDEAMAQYQKALEINPNDAAAHYGLGNALLRKGPLDEALAQYQKTLELNPNSAEVHNDLAVALFQKGRVDEAITEFKKALTINPNNDTVHNDLGFALLQKGRVNEAIAQFQEALRLNPNSGNAQNNLTKALAMARGETGSQ